jgi:nitrogen fixation/metabolism regulation signal transduction histidine kinase
MKNVSLKTKTFILMIFLVLLTSIPIMLYFIKTARALSDLGMEPEIEKSLVRSIELAPERESKEESAGALKKYRQIKALKSRIITQVLFFSAFYSIAIVIISMIIGYFFIAKITRPLRNLTEATRKLSMDKLDYRLDDSAGGEIGQLVKSFNTMAGDLETARQQRAIAERRATWQRVARTIAHEIKNPLTPIKLSTERMYDKFLNQSKDFPDVIKSTTNTILNEIGNLQKLVDSFHKYAKFPDPVLKPEDLDRIIRDAVTLFAAQGAAIGYSCKGPLPELMLDKGQMREVLVNLVKNSIEAVEEKAGEGRITIESRYDSDGVMVQISDNGCGISEEDQKRLFQPYFTTKKHGNGLGLALTERIISLNGGTITCKSTQDAGTTFTIIFKNENI